MKKIISGAILSILFSVSGAFSQAPMADLLKSKNLPIVEQVGAGGPVPSGKPAGEPWEQAIETAQKHLSKGRQESFPKMEAIHRAELPMPDGKPDAEAFYIGFEYQTHQGVPIYGTAADVRVMGSDVEILRGSWRPLSEINISVSPKMTEQEARGALYGKKLQGDDELNGYDLQRPGKLGIYPIDKPGAKTEYRLIWAIRTREDSWPPGRQWTIFVDANTGEVLKARW